MAIINLNKKAQPLTAEQYAWAASVGVSRKRADWLASCPMLTNCGTHMKYVKELSTKPDRNLVYGKSIIYFRYQPRNQKAINIRLDKDPKVAREMRDALEKIYVPARMPKPPLPMTNNTPLQDTP